MLAHRGARHGDVRLFDRFFAPAWLVLALVTPVAAGMDHRLGWSDAFVERHSLALPSAVGCFAGIALLVLAYALGTWAMLVNRHFEQFVRIQTDRTHTVVTGGPYRIVRHPGYLAAIVGAVATPMILGSLSAAACAAALVALFWWRTAREDAALAHDLAGYGAYARHTRSKLVPGIW